MYVTFVCLCVCSFCSPSVFFVKSAMQRAVLNNLNMDGDHPSTGEVSQSGASTEKLDVGSQLSSDAAFGIGKIGQSQNWMIRIPSLKLTART